MLLFTGFQAHATIDAALQMQLGNPSGATVDTNNHDHYLIQRPVEAIDYNDRLGEPNWASWDLTASDLGSVTRSPNFFVDTNLPPTFYLVGTSEYSGSGYDRGHLCPSADRTDTTNDNEMVFYMSNIIPQAPQNNSGVWANFESYSRSLVLSTNDYELLIIAGPGGFDGSRINTNGYVAIPQFTWKILVVVPPGPGAALSRVTATNRVIAIKVPNTNGVSSVWQTFVTSVNQIQVDTGYTFFTALPSDVALVLRNKVDGQTNLPPTLFSFSPTSGAPGSNVTITGTNFTGASQVAFNGIMASFTVDSDWQITAIVPTNAASGLISVTTSSGAAISTNSFTVLSDGGGTYSGIIVGWDASALPGGLNDYGPSPWSPNTNAPNVIVTGLTRGFGVGQSGTAAASGWGGTGFTSATASDAIASGQFATFVVAAAPGYELSFNSISTFNYRHSTTGPTNGVLQFQVGSTSFTDITNLNYSSSSSSGGSLVPIDLSAIDALQRITEPVTFRIVNYGGTNSRGTWYINDAGSAALDLAVLGAVSQILVTNTPATAPTLSVALNGFNQLRLTVSGTTSSNYILQATSELNIGWTSILTNSAPFEVIESATNGPPQRFYRARIAP